VRIEPNKTTVSTTVSNRKKYKGEPANIDARDCAVICTEPICGSDNRYSFLADDIPRRNPVYFIAIFDKQIDFTATWCKQLSNVYIKACREPENTRRPLTDLVRYTKPCGPIDPVLILTALHFIVRGLNDPAKASGRRKPPPSGRLKLVRQDSSQHNIEDDMSHDIANAINDFTE